MYLGSKKVVVIEAAHIAAAGVLNPKVCGCRRGVVRPPEEALSFGPSDLRQADSLPEQSVDRSRPHRPQ